MAKVSMRMRVLLSLFLAAFCMAPRGWPQTTMGGVSGTVRDQTGAVIPNVAIGLTNTATNAVVNTVTNEVGFYIFPSVAPGTYTLSAQSPGMQKFEGTFTVRVADRVVIDPSMTPGLAATAVEVKEITPLVSTDNATVSATLERERLSKLQ